MKEPIMMRNAEFFELHCKKKGVVVVVVVFLSKKWQIF